MGLFQHLYEAYDLIMESENHEGLLPIGFITQKAHIELILSEEAKLISARVVPQEESPTLVPATEKSASRTSGAEAHPMMDKIIYISKDYPKYMDTEALSEKKIRDRENRFSLYEKELKKLMDSVKEDIEKEAPYDAKRALGILDIIYQYVTSQDLIKDLYQHQILKLIQGKIKTDSKEDKKEDKKEEKTELLKVLSNNQQEEAFVRFKVQKSGIGIIKAWADKQIWKAHLSYLNKEEGDQNLCMITGQIDKVADKHPRALRKAGDGAKLLSSNDNENYTYRGRFTEPWQASTISYEVSQKFHGVLKYLIEKQGYNIEDRVFLHFNTEMTENPSLCNEDCMFDGTGEEGRPARDKEVLQSTGEWAANQIRKAFKGYGQVIDFSKTVTSVILDAATKGRLSVLYYNELPQNMFLERIKDWHQKTAWENIIFVKGANKETYHKRFFVVAPAIRDIVNATVGENANEKLKKATFQRIYMMILEGQGIPQDLLNLSIQRASNPMGFHFTQWDKQLRIACSLYRNYCNTKKKEEWDMSLQRENRDRSYLYGRLLAVADKIERDVAYMKNPPKSKGENASEEGDSEKKESRPTNAWRYMNAFRNHPYRTWQIIMDALNPYIAQLDQKKSGLATIYHKELDQIHSLFREEDYMNNRPLDGIYLLAFFNQRKELWERDKDKASS